MSRQYQSPAEVPNEVLAARLDRLVVAATAGDYGRAWRRMQVLSIPAEVDSDVDCVLSEAAKRLRAMSPAMQTGAK